jgi:hypothetical protein
MSVSIQELDVTVRAFYEGKGDVVSSANLLCLYWYDMLIVYFTV